MAPRARDLRPHFGYTTLMLDWSDGQYELTASALAEVSVRVLEALAPAQGVRVVDVGCGTGNAAMEAARRGARATGVDPAARLLEVAAARARAEQLDVEWRVGEGGALPLPDASFDAAVAVFSIIFAPDPVACVSEVRRVVRPGGRVLLTTWLAEGPVNRAVQRMQTIVGEMLPHPDTLRPAHPAWGDPDYLRTLWLPDELTLTRGTVRLTAPSAEAWFGQQEAHHPGWRATRRMLAGHPGAWERVRADSVGILRAGNVLTEGWAVDSAYWLVDVRLAARV